MMKHSSSAISGLKKFVAEEESEKRPAHKKCRACGSTRHTTHRVSKEVAAAASRQRKPKLGSGARFKQLKGKLASKGAKDPGALAAWIGRKKYGAKKMSQLAAKGKAKRSAAAPAGARKPFGLLKTDAQARAGERIRPGIISQSSPQHKFDTGKTLLKKAMTRVSKEKRR